MNQTRAHSALETATNVAVGYLVAVGSQVAIFPLFGIAVPLSSNFAIGGYFTVISIIRSYALRRWFTKRRRKEETGWIMPARYKELAAYNAVESTHIFTRQYRRKMSKLQQEYNVELEWYMATVKNCTFFPKRS